jgi:hypothetical protein|tara:strand:+ start:552 stop:839 length:288 start_codon:yes stop_codon:yes gene_type:complete
MEKIKVTERQLKKVLSKILKESKNKELSVYKGIDLGIRNAAFTNNLDKVSEDESHHASSQQRKKTYKFKTKDGSHDVKITFEVTDNNKNKTEKES